MHVSEVNMIINRFQKGDSEALTYIFNLYHKDLLTYAWDLTAEKEEAEDIVTEAFFKLWRLHKEFEALGNIKGFLYIAVRNACYDFLRNAQRKTAARKEFLYVTQDTIVSEDDMQWAELQSEVFNIVLEEIENLPKKCRIVLKLIYFENLSTAQISERLHLSRQTVLNHKRYAIALLRIFLTERNLLLLSCYLLERLLPGINPVSRVTGSLL